MIMGEARRVDPLTLGVSWIMIMAANEAGTNRVDGFGRAFAGSQLQTQIYVARRQDQLSLAVQRALSEAGARTTAIEWTAPLESRRFQEPVDNAFLDALRLADHHRALREFWPRGGPNWDALAILGNTSRPGAMLVESKSYPAEVYGPGCRAKSQQSKELIQSSLARTQKWLGVTSTVNWLGRLYQYGNRLAHLYFLREVLDVDTWLVNLCFTNDVTRIPVTEDEWRSALPTFKRNLGFAIDRIPWVVNVFLPGRPRSEISGDVAG